jgi:hypothetical protein
MIERRGNRKMKNLTILSSLFISPTPPPPIDTEIAEFVSSQMCHRSTSLSRVVSGEVAKDSAQLFGWFT